MTTTIRPLYTRMRNAGYTASESHRAAKIADAFEQAESDGLVRLRAEHEQENYFDVYGEPDGYTNINGHRVTAEQERQEIVDSIERYGNVRCISEYWDGEEWQHADSIGMCAGYKDPRSPVHNCYVTDLQRAALSAIENMAIAPAI